MALLMARLPVPERAAPERLCALATALPRAPLLCVGDPVLDEEVIGFFLPGMSHRVVQPTRPVLR